MVAWSTTKTALREAKYNLRFGPVMLYDGAGIAAKKSNTAVVALSDMSSLLVYPPTQLFVLLSEALHKQLLPIGVLPKTYP